MPGYGNRSHKKGVKIEYLELLSGSSPSQKDDLFSGINTTWARVKGGKEIADRLSQVEKDYSFEAPYKSIPALVRVWTAIQELEDSLLEKNKIQRT